MADDHQFVRNLLGEQRRRAVGTLMRHVETHVYPHLPPGEQESLRRAVIGVLGSYHDIALDIVKSSVSTGEVQNHEMLEMLVRMEGKLNATLNGKR